MRVPGKMDGALSRKHSVSLRAFLRAALLTVLLCVVAFSLCSCKPTDFFTEIVITPFADIVDEDNPDKTIINSPEAQEESSDLSALEWTEESSQSEDVENLVVYSSDPTTDMQTHHSVYDLGPMFPGIEASDGVRLVANSDEELEGEASSVEQNEQQSQDYSEEQLTSEEQQSLDSDTTSEIEGGTSTTDGDSAGEGSASGGEGNDPFNSGQGASSVGDEGNLNDPSSGAGGDMRVYDENNGFEEAPHADCVAVLGSDASVLVQSIGGRGAICAMSSDAFTGGTDSTCASSFAEVFSSSGDIEADFQERCVLWENDGSSPDDLGQRVQALANACGQGGVIIYDQRLGDQYSIFNDSQRVVLNEYGITLIPIETSSVQGLIDAASVIGDVLSESYANGVCAQDAQGMASSYVDAIRSIRDASYRCRKSSTSIGSVIATDFDRSLSSGSGINLSDGVLFAQAQSASTPLFDWMDSAGIFSNTTYAGKDYPDDFTNILWPFDTNYEYRSLNYSNRSGAYSRWLTNSTASNTDARTEMIAGGSSAYIKFGLGSETFPYLIVSAADGLTSTQVKECVTRSISSYTQRSTVTLYSAFPYQANSDMEGYRFQPTGGSIDLYSTIGMTGGTRSESPFLTGLSASSVVREQPIGLLGSWTEGSMESVLECAWLTDLYSHSASGCDYSPINDMESFSCTIGGISCSTTEDAVKAFYKYFYRLSDERAGASASNVEKCYDAAVPDKFADLG